MYNAAELDQKIVLKRETSTPDGMGGYVKSWCEIAKTWALVRPLKGRERERAQQIEASSDYLVVIRYRDDVREKDIVIWNGRTLNIRFCEDGGPRSRFLPIYAEMGVAA